MNASRSITVSLGRTVRIHELISAHTDDPATVIIGIAADRGLLVRGLVAAGYTMYALNPFSVSQTTGPNGNAQEQLTLNQAVAPLIGVAPPFTIRVRVAVLR